jgi:hypothetical protein
MFITETRKKLGTTLCSMFTTVSKRLNLLIETQKKIDDSKIKFDVETSNFGFKRMEQLYPVKIRDDIKGYPCIAYDKFSDSIKFGIKVIPLESRYREDSHPCRIEVTLIKEFTKLVRNYVTPHVTYFFKDMMVSNKKKSLTRFPLKSLRHDILKESKVLIAEYVPGGSIEEWIQEQPNITEKQWKYIVFSVAWTLLVLQNEYKFMHNDFHYGNILIDTSIDPTDSSFIKYVLNKNGHEQTSFNVQNVGLLPKIWDFEFASTYAPNMTFQNEFFKSDENENDSIPHEFNPYYDLHYFLVTLLDLDIPDRLRDFILDLYPEDVLPPIGDHSDDSTMDSNDQDEEYYRTDESDCSGSETETETETETYFDSETTNSSMTDSSEIDTETESYDSEESQIRTDYMYGPRLLNGTEKVFKLPTPLEILESSYFAEYRKPIPKRGRTDVVFTYELPGNDDESSNAHEEGDQENIIPVL